MGRATKVVLLCTAVAAAGAGGIAYASNQSGRTATEDRAIAELATVEVDQKDLVTYEEITATLGFTTSVTVSSPVEGTVTGIVSTGDTIDAGTVVATIDGAPVVALVGDMPGFRDLDEDVADGSDVRQLEQNLVLLGFDPDGAISIDETFDEATADAVTMWEDSLGLDGDGAVPEGQIVFVPGRLLVDDVSASVGSGTSAGSALLTGRQAERKLLVAATVADGGRIDEVVPAGTPVATGTVLFWENFIPVVAIEGDAVAIPALTRDLSVGVDDGGDVKLFEQMLVTGGFDPSGAITIDDHFDAATSFGVVLWRDSLGLPRTEGDVVVPAGSYVVVPSGLEAGAPLVEADATVASEVIVLTLTSPARAVTTTAPIGDETFALGATIDVEFPDGTVEPGTVVEVGNVATNPSGVPGETPSVTITIHVGDIPNSVDSFVQIPVTLRVVDEQVPGAFVVPVSALVALAEGGFAVEVVDGQNPDGTPATHLIGVTPGLFTDGFVAVTGDQLADGLTVVVPS